VRNAAPKRQLYNPLRHRCCASNPDFVHCIFFKESLTSGWTYRAKQSSARERELLR